MATRSDIFGMMGGQKKKGRKPSGMEMVFGKQPGTFTENVSLSNPLPTAAGDSPGVQSLLQGMTQGTRKTTVQRAPGGGTVQASRTYEPKMEDFLPEALALDRQAQMSALLEQRAQEEEAIGEMRGGLERGTSRLREAAQERPRQSRADIDPYRQQHQELQDQRLAELDAMQGQIDQITAEYTQNVTNLRDEALSALENRAPEQAEQAIRTMTKNAAEKKQNIVNQYAQMGLGQDHPAVQAALQQVDEQTMASSADVWQRAAIAHNQMETQVRSNYDNYIQAAEGGRAQARLSGVRAKEQGLYQAQEANRAFAALESSLHQQARQMATQLEAQAAQLEVMGSQALADALRDRTIAWSPIAPLVAANFALQEGDTATGFTMPNVQGYNLNTMFQGGGPTGTGNLSAVESSIHDVLRRKREKQAQKG